MLHFGLSFGYKIRSQLSIKAPTAASLKDRALKTHYAKLKPKLDQKRKQNRTFAKSESFAFFRSPYLVVRHDSYSVLKLLGEN